MIAHAFAPRTPTMTTAPTAAAPGAGLPLALPVELRTIFRRTWWELPKVKLRARTVLRLASLTSFLAAAGAAAALEPALTRFREACNDEAPGSPGRWARDRGAGPSTSPSQAGAVSTVRGCVAEIRRGLSARLSLPLLLLSVLAFVRARTDEEMPAAGGVR